MAFLIKLLLAVASSATVQKVVLDQLETLAKRSDNTVDDRVVEVVRNGLANRVDPIKRVTG